jgi:hypothetical protein
VSNVVKFEKPAIIKGLMCECGSKTFAFERDLQRRETYFLCTECSYWIPLNECLDAVQHEQEEKQ